MNVLSAGGSRVLAIELEVMEMKNLELVAHRVVAEELALCHIDLGSLGVRSGRGCWNECFRMPGDDEQQQDEKLLVKRGHYSLIEDLSYFESVVHILDWIL